MQHDTWRLEQATQWVNVTDFEVYWKQLMLISQYDFSALNQHCASLVHQISCSLKFSASSTQKFCIDEISRSQSGNLGISKGKKMIGKLLL